MRRLDRRRRRAPLGSVATFTDIRERRRRPNSTGELSPWSLRLDHPTHGLLAPEAFIDVAEDSDRIVPIGRWVLHEACRQLAAWRSA